MRVLLINPEFPDTYWSFRHALPFEGKRCAFPPLGLLTVSALLPPDWERRLIDLNVESLKTKDIEWADMVFATAMLVQKDGERKEFWRFFSQALIKHHHKIAETLRLAAMGYHFRKLNDAYSEPPL